MMLVTQEIEKKMPALYSTDGKGRDRQVICKFFTPDSNWTWLILEGEKKPDGDWLFFGLVMGLETELGYITLNELKSARGPMGLAIERDRHFGNPNFGDAAPEFCDRLWPEA